MRVYIVDDDPLSLSLVEALLTAAGHRVFTNPSSRSALEEIPRLQPDCVILDLVMPEIDGLSVCRRLREDRRLRSPRIVVLSIRSFESDRFAAFAAGADAYLMKPIRPSSFADQLAAICDDRIRVCFWGVRGSLAVPGERSLRYGGNTACVSCELPRGELLVFDAGSGLKELSDELRRDNGGRIQGRILLTHPHWDHIHALPFFAPLYVRGSELEICGPAPVGGSIRDLVAAQLDGVYFPVTVDQLAARVYFRDLEAGSFELGGYPLHTLRLRHPGHCLGYRLDVADRSLCYVTDHEIFPPDHALGGSEERQRWVDFVRGAETVIADTTYFEEEYASRIGWGHATVDRVVELAAEAGVANLFLFHHDPDQNDDAIDRKLETATRIARRLGSALVCRAPREGERILV